MQTAPKQLQNWLDETLNSLREFRQQSASVVVAFSGGKDSLCVMDLCLRTFSRVEAFCMELIPGMRCVERELALAEARWGVKIKRYPHWVAARLMRNRVYQFTWGLNLDIPEIKLHDIYKLAMHDTNCPLLATGAKRADSLWRKRSMSTGTMDGVVYPIAAWNKFHVLSYLKLRNIPVPPSSERSATGIDLTAPSVLWLYDNYRDDFDKLCSVFPLAEAIVYRRHFYGIV